jgi:16S rRNA (uracil1498-N3)-methyltransferase
LRWQRIASEAAMQSGRGVIPEVLPVSGFSEAIRSAPGLRLFCYEEERTLHLRDALVSDGTPETVSLFIGPEGGFAESEAKDARDAGATSVSLGRRILRTESAAPFVLACLAYELDK